jgi:hypothetical protein
MKTLAPTLIFLGLAAFILYPSPWLLWEGYHSKAWPHADGVIHSTKIVEQARSSRYGDGSWHIPVIVYHYQIGAISYTNSRVVFASFRPHLGYGSQAEAQAIVDRYPAGKSVTVFYEPSSPADAVLEPGIQNSVLRSDAVAAVLIACALLLPLLRKRRSNNALESAAIAPVTGDSERKIRLPFLSIKVTRRACKPRPDEL